MIEKKERKEERKKESKQASKQARKEAPKNIEPNAIPVNVTAPKMQQFPTGLKSIFSHFRRGSAFRDTGIESLERLTEDSGFEFRFAQFLGLLTSPVREATKAKTMAPPSTTSLRRDRAMRASDAIVVRAGKNLVQEDKT